MGLSTTNLEILSMPGIGNESREPQTRSAILELSRVFDAGALSRALNRLADCGWNSVVLPGFMDGYPIFPSSVWADYGLRRQHPQFCNWDPLEVAFDVAWRRKLDIILGITPYLIDWHGFRRPPLLRKYPQWSAARHPKRKRAQTSLSSHQIYYCPVNLELRRFISDTLCVLAEAYPFHGILFDLRYYPFYSEGAGNFALYCYCKSCRKATLRDLGFDPVSVDFIREKSMVERWRDWQTQQMDNAMGYMRLRALKARCTMRILGLLTTDSGPSANRPEPLIHWKGWVERSLVEALVLDGYSPDPKIFEGQLQNDLQTLPHNSLLLPMLPRKVEDSDAFKRIYASNPIPGFTTRFDDWDSPDFDPTARAVFDNPAFSVESDPIYSICVLFAKMAKAAYFEKDFVEFLSDMARILANQEIPLTVERLLMVAENVQGLYGMVLSGKVDFGARRAQMLHDLDLAGRLAYLAGCDLID